VERILVNPSLRRAKVPAVRRLQSRHTLRVLEVTLRVLEVTLRVLEGTLKALEVTLRVLEGTLRVLEGTLTLLEPSPLELQARVTVVRTTAARTSPSRLTLRRATMVRAKVNSPSQPILSPAKVLMVVPVLLTLVLSPQAEEELELDVEPKDVVMLATSSWTKVDSSLDCLSYVV
jgi:hypothetical protein